MRASFITGEVVTGLRRNVTMTIAMILTTAISLGLFGAGLLVVRMADKSQDIFMQRVEIQVYLTQPDQPGSVLKDDANCQQSQCQDLEKQLSGLPGVDSLEFISADKALTEAKTKTFANQPELADLVRPGVLPASFRLRVEDEKQFTAVVEAAQALKGKGVDTVLDQRDLVERMFSVLNGARNGAFLVAVIQAIAAILLIANTVQVAAYTRRTEVSIMRLVGATRWYTQLPFLLEAVVASVIGGLLAIGGLFVAKIAVFDRAFEEIYGVNILARITAADVLLVAPWLLLTGAVFAAGTAYLTLRFYVRD